MIPVVSISSKPSTIVSVISLNFFSLSINLKEKELQLFEGKQKLKEEVNRLNTALSELKTVDRMKTNFLATTSHELKTPITPLMAQLQFLKRGDFGKLSIPQKTSVEMIERNIKRLNNLITEVLDESKLLRGKVELIKSTTDLNYLINEVIQTLQPKTIKQKVAISTTPNKIPMVECDSDKIIQVLINFIDNALKYTPMGSIWIDAKKKGNSVVVSIKDNGQGMKKIDLPKLFKPFTQLNPADIRPMGGTGLGLSICKHLIDMHGGKIWADSPGIGKGSTFYFSLPIKSTSNKEVK